MTKQQAKKEIGDSIKKIDCCFLPIKEQFPHFDREGNVYEGGSKCGKYLSSCLHSIPDYGTKKFAFGAYIKVEDEELIEIGKEKQLVEDCLPTLNKVWGGKKKFGELEIYSAHQKTFVASNKRYLSVVLITNMRKNAHIWGEGYKKQSYK